MTTDAEVDLQPNLTLELDAAFLKSSQQQQSADSTQNQSEDVEESTDSSEQSGTTSASSDAPLTKAELLASLTIDEIKSHPELGKLFQSAVDTTASGMLKGTRASIEREVQLNVARQHFAALSPDELSSELTSNPEAAKMYGIVVSQTPPQLDPATQATVDFYKRELDALVYKLENSGLDDTTKANLNPNLHLVQAGDPPTILAAYKSKLEDAIIDAKVAKKVGTVTKTDAKADELNRQASDVANSVDPLMTNGTRTAPQKDFMTTRSDVLLYDAFDAPKTRR